MVIEKQVPNLLYLIRFRLISQGLQVDNLVHALLVEQGMAGPFPGLRVKPARSRRWQRSEKEMFASERPERISERIFRDLLMNSGFRFSGLASCLGELAFRLTDGVLEGALLR